MTLLPVVERELRVAARRWQSYWGRTLAAFAGVALTFWCLWVSGPNATPSRELFGLANGASLALCLLAGPFFSADSLARERREGTLGLLFLTALRGRDIALGKLTACSLSATYCLFAVLPVLAIPLLLGGVTGSEYARMLLLHGVTLFSSLCLGLLASTLTSDSRSAVSVSMFLVGFWHGVWPLVGLVWWRIIRDHDPNGDLFSWAFSWESAISAFILAFDSDYQSHPIRYWAGLAYVLAGGVLALLWTSLRLPRLRLDTGSAAKARPKRFTKSPPLPSPASSTWRESQLAQGAIVWLCNRRIRQVATPWYFWLGILGVWCLASLFFGEDWRIEEGWVAFSFGIHFCFKLWLCNEAPRVFYEARQTGAMELLLTTALSPKDFIASRLRALRQRFVGPTALLLVLDAAYGLRFVTDFRSHSGNETFGYFWYGRILLFAADAVAIAWTGTWLSLAMKSNRITLAVWSRVVVLPGIGFVLLGMGRVLNSSESALFFWMLLSLLNAAIWTGTSFTRLNAEFREQAMRPTR